MSGQSEHTLPEQSTLAMLLAFCRSGCRDCSLEHCFNLMFTSLNNLIFTTVNSRAWSEGSLVGVIRIIVTTLNSSVHYYVLFTY